MSTVVKADDMAVQASSNFLNIINNQLMSAFASLNKAGATLSDPTHWAGADASKFQSDIWPKAQTDLKNMQNALTDLQRQVDKVLGNIMRAGGN